MSDWDQTEAGAADATLRSLGVGTRVFGRFVLERKLGQGGMGVVWLGRDERLEQEVALKFLPENIRMDPVAVADLKRETKRALKLTHPNIVRVHDFHEDGGLAAIAMEYVEGASLSAVRAEQPGMCLEARQLAPVMGPLCAALEYAHGEAKFVHRDIKPANLMVDREWRIKITDFGIARSLVESMSRLSAGRSTSGTLVYMSPQQLDGEPPSPSDDIYSLGATMYELLTGKPPFFSGDISKQIAEKVPPPMAQRRAELGVGGDPIPLQWEAVVAACLAKDAAKRPRTAGEVGARLRAGSGSGVLGAGGDPTPKPERIGAGNRHSIINVPGGAEGGIRRAETATESGKLKTGKRGGLIATVLLLLAAAGGAGWWFGAEAPRLEAERVVAEQRLEAEARQREEETRKAAEADKARLEQERLAREEAQRKQAEEQGRQRQAAMEAERERMEAERLAKARGGLLVRTEPAGAMVRVDGGEGNPGPVVTFSDLKLGKHRVSVTAAGHAAKDLEAEVLEDKVTEVGPVALEALTGMVVVESEPTGAAVIWSDGRRLGVTPLRLNKVPAGEVSLRLEMEGYEPKQVRGTAVAGLETSLAVVLSVTSKMSDARNQETYMATSDSRGKNEDCIHVWIGTAYFKSGLTTVIGNFCVFNDRFEFRVDDDKYVKKLGTDKIVFKFNEIRIGRPGFFDAVNVIYLWKQGMKYGFAYSNRRDRSWTVENLERFMK